MANNSYEKTFPRTTKYIGKLADYLYKDVLLYCESDNINKLKGADITSKKFQIPIKGEILLDYKSHIVRSRGAKSYLDSSIVVGNLNNEILFIPTGNKLVSLIKHIRNAYAHNLVIIDLNDAKYVIIADFLTHKNGVDFTKPTMLGRLSKDNLKFLIEQVKSLSK